MNPSIVKYCKHHIFTDKKDKPFGVFKLFGIDNIGASLEEGKEQQQEQQPKQKNAPADMKGNLNVGEKRPESAKKQKNSRNKELKQNIPGTPETPLEQPQPDSAEVSVISYI